MSEHLILGGGVTGLAAGIGLARAFPGRVRIIEKEAATGGLASTLDLDGWGADLGSHRIHHNYDPKALELIRPLLGDDLVRRPRRGRIRIAGRFLDYPPNVMTLLSGIGWSHGAAALAGYCLRRRPAPGTPVHFENYAESQVGRGLYRLFYRPYAVKLWGVDPSELAPDPAVQRLTKLSWKRLRSDAVRLVQRRSPTYLYPRRGIGQIASALREAFVRAGGRVTTSAEVLSLTLRPSGASPSGPNVSEVRLSSGEVIRDPRTVICTLPLRRIAGLIGSDWDASGLGYRALRILYLMYPASAETPHETYYVPDPDFRIGRVSQPAAYSPNLSGGSGQRLFTVELPCAKGDRTWEAPADELARDCHREMQTLGILKAGTPEPACRGSASLADLYPVHTLGWKDRLTSLLERTASSAGIFAAGRSALFLHCNIDHCVVMGLRLAEHLAAGGTAEDWTSVVRTEFFNFQVKD